MNGQNRLSAALSFMIGCNYSLQDWRLKPCSIDPWKTLDDSGLVDLTDDSIKEYKVYGQVVGSFLLVRLSSIISIKLGSDPNLPMVFGSIRH